MLKNQIESWKQFGLSEGFSEGKKNRLEFECDVDFFDYVSSDICNKLDLMKFNLWYKTDEYSVIQSIICVDTDFYKGKQLKDSEEKDLRLTQYFLVRSKMIAENGALFVTYKFEPEHIEMVYSNYDLNKLAEYIQSGNKPNDLIRKN
jgi:hypothetical protein